MDGKTTRAGFFAANRSGKSDAGAYVGAHLARFGPPNPKSCPFPGAQIEMRDRATSGWVISRDFPASREVVQPKYFDNGLVSPGAHKPFIPDREIRPGNEGFKVNEQILRLKNGSLIGFKSSASEALSLAGAGKDWIHIDEECRKEHFEESTIRVEAGRRLIVFITATLLPPLGEVGGVSWMFQEIIKPYLDGESDWRLFGASMYDNPYLDKAEIALQEAAFPTHTPQGRIRILGEWLPGIAGALAYPSFNRRIHVGDVLAPNPRSPLAWCWDFNVEPLITLIGYKANDDVFRVWKELVIEEGNIPDMCQLFYEAVPEHRSEVWIYGDATGTNRSSQFGQSDYTTIFNHMRQYNLPLRRKVPEKNPLQSDRINSMNRALKNEIGASMVEINRDCKELIDDMEGVLIDPYGGIKKSRNRREIYFRRTHSSDALGYWVHYESPVKNILQTTKRKVFVRDARYGF